MIEIVFLNQSNVWEATLKHVFSLNNFRFYSISDFLELSQWENVEYFLIIVEQEYLDKECIDLDHLRARFPFIKNWKLLKNNNAIDPLKFKNEVLLLLESKNEEEKK